MAFTTVTLTRDYDLADGTDPTGTVTFTPTTPMVNGVTVVAAPVVARLDVDGILTIELAANNDPATLPTGSYYLVQEAVGGASRSYYVQIPYNLGASIDLATLDTITSPVAPDAVTFATLLAAKQPLATLLTRLATAPITVVYAASITLAASTGSVFRVTATGNLTLADITNGTDGQTVALEVLASGADRTVTVTGGSTTNVPSGTWWTGNFRFNATANAWLLI